MWFTVQDNVIMIMAVRTKHGARHSFVMLNAGISMTLKKSRCVGLLSPWLKIKNSHGENLIIQKPFLNWQNMPNINTEKQTKSSTN